MDRLERMALSDKPELRRVAAAHPKISRRFLMALIMDDDVTVRREAVKNANVTEGMIVLAIHDADVGIVAYAKMLKYEDEDA